MQIEKFYDPLRFVFERCRLKFCWRRWCCCSSYFALLKVQDSSWNTFLVVRGWWRRTSKTFFKDIFLFSKFYSKCFLKYLFSISSKLFYNCDSALQLISTFKAIRFNHNYQFQRALVWFGSSGNKFNQKLSQSLPDKSFRFQTYCWVTGRYTSNCIGRCTCRCFWVILILCYLYLKFSAM